MWRGAAVMAVVGSLACTGTPAGSGSTSSSSTGGGGGMDASVSPDSGVPDAGGCAPNPSCTPDCNPCGTTCTRGNVNPVDCACVPVQLPDVLALSITPSNVGLAVGERASLVATRTNRDCSTATATQEVVWQSNAPGVARFVGLGSLEGVAPGNASVTASLGAVLSNSAAVTVSNMPVVPRELRGLWITRFAYNSQASLEGIIDRAAGAGFNAVFVQIRGAGDAYYQSNVEPWARGLTGTLGQDPGWDPLRVALNRGHMLGIQVHAYFNALSAWTVSLGAPPMAEGNNQHALYTHPDWLAVTSNGVNEDTEYMWFSPGIPEVRAHIAAVATDLLARYEVDGLHLDRIRTAGRDYSHDAVSNAAFAAAQAQTPALTWADFMRTQVNLTVAEIHAALVATRPRAAFSASVWGIYNPLPGCNTSAGYRDYYQDSRAWLANGTMDALVPMIYWPIAAGACTNWAALLDGFLGERANRHIWAGMHALDDNTFNITEIQSRVAYARTASAQGTVVFASTYLDQGTGRWDAFDAVGGPFAQPADVPVMPWKP